jgi:excisionase family DNA binding protein
VGFGLAQQMMQQGFAGGAATPTVAPAQPGIADLMSPADAAKALGVTETDVLTILESGELKAKKIGTAWRIRRAAIDEYLAQ